MGRPKIPTPEQYRSQIRHGIAAGDWRAPYEWAKSWISSGGGARQLDPWLAYVASGLLKGEPRTATHALDLALKNWISAEEDRAILLWVRSRVIRGRLRDPKTALVDLEAAMDSGPGWLADVVAADLRACRAEAEASRKRKPAVKVAPTYSGTDTPVEPPTEHVPSGSMPELWSDIQELLHVG